MSDTLQSKIQALQNDYTAKMQQIQASGDYAAMGPLAEALQAQIAELVAQEQAHIEKSLQAVPERSPYYRHDDCTLDLDKYVYDGDRDYFAEFKQHPLIAQLHQEQQQHQTQGPDLKRELLKRALRLSAVMAPKVFNALERCRAKLGFKPDTHVYVSQDPSMNAFCYPPHQGAVHILLTSALLEKLNEDELTFVMGHEIGHFLYHHHELHPRMIHERLQGHLTPAEGIKLFAWSRNAELSADRIGLICCGNYEAACMANFKISSGVSSDALLFSLNDYIHQYEDMEKDISSGEATMEDFYSSHPINPIRVIALDVFHRSETYLEIFEPNQVADFSESAMEDRIAGFMRLMEPQYLQKGDEASKRIKETLFLAGYAIASADGEVEPEEMAYLASILPGENHQALESKLKGWSVDMLMAALGEQIDRVRPHLSPVSACNMIRDLTVVALSDGELTQPEMDCLCHICISLNIHPSFVEQVINSIQYQQAA